jgi:alcohol dehydrogenase class IV
MEILSRVLDLPKRRFDGVMEWLLAFREELGVPHTLKDIGVGEDKVSELAQHAERDPSTGGNPVPLKAADFEVLILDAIRGNLGGSK